VPVSNAGYLPRKASIVDSDLKDWWSAYEVNDKAALLVTRALLDNATSDAVLINITAGLAHMPPTSGLSSYATSKLANAKFYEYVQFEEPDLRVFDLHPGVIVTGMAKKATAGGMVKDSFWDTREPAVTLVSSLLTLV